MLLEFKKIHRSITEFDSIDLPDFTILTGINGSGKTQLLQALTNGDVQINGINPKDVVYFDHIKFRIENEANFNKEQLSQERATAWSFFIQQNIPSLGVLKSHMETKKNQYLKSEDCEKIKKIIELKNKPLFDLNKEDLENNEELNNKFVNYKQSILDVFSNDNVKNHPYTQSILALFKNFTSFPDEITKIEFSNLYVPTTLKENFLPMQIGKIFLDFRIKEWEELHKSVDVNMNESGTALQKKAEQKCRAKYGGSTPWDILNEFLKAFRNFDYEISYPKQFSTEYYFYQSDPPFIPELKNNKKNISINYEDLSSGEQILFSLALCLFKGQSDNVFPKLLLLDEIDATLHPSMIENLLHVIQDVLLKRGTRVILATHSPTTVAISPEESIFIVNKEGRNRIEKHERKEALEILTQGYMTLDEGIKIFDQISKKEIPIITEGNNTGYIEIASNLFASDIKNKIEIIKGAESRSGDTQLKTLFDFFTTVSHDKKVIFVWDCDYEKKIEDKNNTYGFIFARNSSNNLAKAGVENLFDESFFNGFTRTYTDSLGKSDVAFDGQRKKDFLSHMSTHADENTFRNFKPLFDYIRTILQSESSVDLQTSV